MAYYLTDKLDLPFETGHRVCDGERMTARVLLSDC